MSRVLHLILLAAWIPLVVLQNREGPLPEEEPKVTPPRVAAAGADNEATGTGTRPWKKLNAYVVTLDVSTKYNHTWTSSPWEYPTERLNTERFLTEKNWSPGWSKVRLVYFILCFFLTLFVAAAVFAKIFKLREVVLERPGIPLIATATLLSVVHLFACNLFTIVEVAKCDGDWVTALSPLRESKWCELAYALNRCLPIIICALSAFSCLEALLQMSVPIKYIREHWLSFTIMAIVAVVVVVPGFGAPLFWYILNITDLEDMKAGFIAELGPDEGAGEFSHKIEKGDITYWFNRYRACQRIWMPGTIDFNNFINLAFGFSVCFLIVGVFSFALIFSCCYSESSGCWRRKTRDFQLAIERTMRADTVFTIDQIEKNERLVKMTAMVTCITTFPEVLLNFLHWIPEHMDIFETTWLTLFGLGYHDFKWIVLYLCYTIPWLYPLLSLTLNPDMQLEGEKSFVGSKIRQIWAWLSAKLGRGNAAPRRPSMDDISVTNKPAQKAQV